MIDSSEALADMEFPSDAPRDDCLDAIVAAREYIHEHDGATKNEIVTELVPEENYPLGHNGAAACAKGFSSGFRDWWWNEIVAPGLRTLPDIDVPEIEDRLWLPADQDAH